MAEPNRDGWRKVMADVERQQRELQRLKQRSEELLERPPVERRIAQLAVTLERRKREREP